MEDYQNELDCYADRLSKYRILIAGCPNCGKPLKFNPFFVDMGGRV